MMQVNELLAQFSPAARARLADRLDAASVALWHARRALDREAAPRTSATEWRAHVQTAKEALATVEDMIQTMR